MNWLSYKESLSNFSNKQKGDSFERLTQHYLKYDPQYATKLKKVWLLSEVPQNIHEKLNLPQQDQGIDLICETKDGEYWAVQCKYHENEQQSQTFKSLATFGSLAFVVCKDISFGLVCTTAERFTKTLQDQDNISFCTGEVWRNLDEDFFNSFIRKRKPKKLKVFKPRKHQKRAIKHAFNHYTEQNENRGKMIMPCGTGKSLTAFWIADKLDAQKIIVAVPSLALIRQTLQVWLRESYAKGWDVDWITVCSDQSVGKISRDDLAVLKQDIGIPAITNPKIIAKWLRKRHKGKVIVFTTYHSGKAIAEASRIANRKFDLGIMDEAHKTVGRSDKAFSHLLFDQNINISKRVFMTATERYYTGKTDKIVSMDDYKIYGETFEYLSFKKALESDPPILSDYKIITKIISKAEIEELIRKRKWVKPTRGKWDDEIEADMLASMVILRKAIRRYKIKHAISFHSSIAKAKAFEENQSIFTDLFPQYWKTENYHVSGAMATSLRDRHLREFESSKRAIMTNARCLTEGVDIPDIDCVLFADPKQSKIDTVQAIGRALRVSSGKKYGYVIVPVVIDDTEDFDKSDAFQSILMVLRALAGNDDRIIEYFRDRANGKNPRGPIEIIIDSRIPIKIDEKEFVRQIELQTWNKLAKLSWRSFEDAREFVRSLNFNNVTEWRSYIKSGKKPMDIPAVPYALYKNNGWISFGDWLGTDFIATKSRKYRSFEEAREFVHTLMLKSGSDWQLYCKGKLKGHEKKSDDIPNDPRHVFYNNGWISMSDWLGTDFIATRSRKYRSFEEAREFVHTLMLKSGNEWNLYCTGKLEGYKKKPEDIPTIPGRTYKNKGWLNISDWLGYNPRVKPEDIEWMQFSKAKLFVKKLRLKNQHEWYQYSSGEIRDLPSIPINIPKSPYYIYKNKGWSSWPDWLGKSVTGKQTGWRNYKDAKSFVKKLNLKTWDQWNKYCKNVYPDLLKKPLDIPSKPERVYKGKGFINMREFLGNKKPTNHELSKNYLSFKEAKQFVRKLKLKNWTDWDLYCKGKISSYKNKPSNVPLNPHNVYKNKGWISYADFLGYELKRKKK